MSNVESVANEIKASVDDFKKANAEALAAVKTVAEASATDSKEALAQAKTAIEKVTAVADRLLETEQKLVGNVMSGKAAPKSLGAMVIASDAYKQFCTGATNRMRVEANTIIGQEESPPENSNTIVAPMRLAGIVPGAFRSLRVRDVVPSGVTSSNMVEFTKELVFTNGAIEIAEGYTKGEAALTFELAQAPVRTIAHWIKASKQVLEDAPMLQSYIDTRMRYGVDLRIDAQLLNGNGSGQNLSGMTAAANRTAFTPATGDTALDSINRAKYLIEAADYSPTALIMNPVDWGKIERIKGGDEHYVVGNPQGAIGPVLWGLPVVVSNNMAAGNFLIAAMNIAYQVFNRSGTVVEMFEQDETNVQKNLLTIRAEARLALASYRPASARYGALTV